MHLTVYLTYWHLSVDDTVITVLKQWVESTGRKSGKIIDVGGGSGHIPIQLSKVHQNSKLFQRSVGVNHHLISPDSPKNIQL